MDNNEVISQLDDPEALEALYQRAPKRFSEHLVDALDALPNSETLRVWQARLNFHSPTRQASIPNTLLYFVVGTALFISLLMQLPNFLPIESESFYLRSSVLIVMGAVIGYFLESARQQDALSSVTKTVLIGVGGCALFLGFAPSPEGSDSIGMSFIHIPLVLLSLLGLAFMNQSWRASVSRLLFVRYLGELAIFTVLILLGGMLLTAVTLGLFELIDISITEWYFEYVVVSGLVCSPLVATYLYDAILKRDSKLASVLSAIFSPLFFVTISSYLLATLLLGKSPFSDRNFLITFNGLLLVIWALTVFSISGIATGVTSRLSNWINIGLVAVTLIVNGIALSAILFRWAEYGLTVNRVVVTGANLLIFIHLLIILCSYVRFMAARRSLEELELSVADSILPAYSIWSLFVVAGLPLLFGFA